MATPTRHQVSHLPDHGARCLRLYFTANHAQQVPVDRTVGELETVTTFNGPKPAGVTVAHRGRVVAGKMPCGGLESDAAGNVYLTDPVTDSIHRFSPKTGLIETLVHDPRLLWPDTMSLADDGYLYVTANQLHRQPSMHHGQDMRQKPYQLFRIKVDAQPVRLR